MTNKTCPVCAGKGYVKDFGGLFDETETLDCKRCDGSGKIPANEN